MALSKAKQEKNATARRLAQVKKVWPDYPCGVLDAYIEDDIRRYVATGEVGGYIRSRIGT